MDCTSRIGTTSNTSHISMNVWSLTLETGVGKCITMWNLYVAYFKSRKLKLCSHRLNRIVYDAMVVPIHIKVGK